MYKFTFLLFLFSPPHNANDNINSNNNHHGDIITAISSMFIDDDGSIPVGDQYIIKNKSTHSQKYIAFPKTETAPN